MYLIHHHVLGTFKIIRTHAV